MTSGLRRARRSRPAQRSSTDASWSGMIRTQWRDRLIYLAMSGFVAWHTLAMVLAPAPDNSVIAQSLRGLMQPYLTLFSLDNLWDFFAPTVGKDLNFATSLKTPMVCAIP